MTFDIGSGARVIATTGEAFEAFFLTPEREDVILTCLDAHPAGATTGQVADALGRNIPDASRLLQELADRGKARSETRNNRPLWTRWSLDLDEAKVREAHIPKIRAFLTGRRELAGAIARGIGLPLDEVVHTCRWMQLHGHLVGTPVANLMVYALEARVTTRVDVGRAASIPMSPQAKFRAELAKLGPEPAVTFRPRVTPAPQKAAPEPRTPRPAAAAPLPVKVATQPVRRSKPVKIVRDPRLLPQPAKVFTNARRGRLGDRQRELLSLLQEPMNAPQVAAHLTLDVGDAWSLMKAALERGYIARQSAGVFSVTPDGLKVLRPPKTTRPTFKGKVPEPPAATEGQSWSPEREMWLTAHYAHLGHRAAAERLGLTPAAVWAKAKRLNLQFGDIPGYTLIMDVARTIAALHGMDRQEVYISVWARARKAGVMKYAEGDVEKASRRPLVPVKWAADVIQERTPPSETDMSLQELMDRTGLSKTQATRKAAPYYLRTVTGGQPTVHFPRERGEAIVQAHATRQRPNTPGKAGLLAALEAAGANGLTETELLKGLGVSRAAVRLHTRQLQAQTPAPLEKCRGGTCVDPVVWRLARYAGEPEPASRRPDTSAWGNKTGKRARPARSLPEPAPSPAPEPLPSPDPEPQPAPVQRVVITTALDRQLRAELPPERRRIPGETARVAAKHGLTVSQVRYHLRFTPIPQEVPMT